MGGVLELRAIPWVLKMLWRRGGDGVRRAYLFFFKGGLIQVELL